MTVDTPAGDAVTKPEKLTRAQRELLSWVGSQEGGVTGITDESLVRRLIGKGLVLKFFETTGLELSPVWAITPAGRLALQEAPDV